jgi:hypothetical protein
MDCVLANRRAAASTTAYVLSSCPQLFSLPVHRPSTIPCLADFPIWTGDIEAQNISSPTRPSTAMSDLSTATTLHEEVDSGKAQPAPQIIQQTIPTYVRDLTVEYSKLHIHNAQSNDGNQATHFHRCCRSFDQVRIAPSRPQRSATSRLPLSIAKKDRTTATSCIALTFDGVLPEKSNHEGRREKERKFELHESAI